MLKKIISKVLPTVEKNAVYITLSPGHGPGPHGLDGGCIYNKTKESELNEALVYEKVVELLKRTKNVHINLCYPPQNIFTKKKFETDKRLTKEDLKRIHCAFKEVYMVLPINGSFNKEINTYIRRKVDGYYEIYKAFVQRIKKLSQKQKIIAIEDHHDCPSLNVCTFNPYYRKFEKNSNKNFYNNSIKLAKIITKHCGEVYKVKEKGQIYNIKPKQNDFKITTQTENNIVASLLIENGNTNNKKQVKLIKDNNKRIEMAKKFIDALLEYYKSINVNILEK